MPDVPLKLDIFEAGRLLKCKPDLWHETAACVMQDHITPWRIFTSLNAKPNGIPLKHVTKNYAVIRGYLNKQMKKREKKKRHIQPLNRVGA